MNLQYLKLNKFQSINTKTKSLTPFRLRKSVIIKLIILVILKIFIKFTMGTIKIFKNNYEILILTTLSIDIFNIFTEFYLGMGRVRACLDFHTITDI